MGSSAIVPSEDEESEELRRFREAWKHEVRKAKEVSQSTSTTHRTSFSIQADERPSTGYPDWDYSHSVAGILHELKASHIESRTLLPSKISMIVERFPPILQFEREEEDAVSPFMLLSEELLLYILRYLDHTSIEQFAAVCRKARVLTLDSAIWRDFVISTYKPPQMFSVDDLLDVMKLYVPDYRRLYIEHPRIRLDGVYIATCRYIRPGLGENAWVNINHLITYLRYLRFLPNGQVVSLLASDQTLPQEIIPYLDSSLREVKGLFIGNWELHGTTVYLKSLTEPHGNVARYVFDMTLELQSKPLGRWNRLTFMAYDSINLDTGEAVPVSLKHERSPFLFSKVRSYHV